MFNKNKLDLLPFFKKIMEMSLRKRLFIPLCMLALFVAYQASITLFAHVHYVNGVMLVHSHPSSDNQHTHTEGQILTLAQISSFDGIEPLCSCIENVCPKVLYTLDSHGKSAFISVRYAYALFLRAPPYCS